MTKTDISFASLKENYLRWLGSQLISEGDQPDRSYSELVHVMFDQEFFWGADNPWSIPMDDNRLADGMELRAEFSEAHGVSRANMLTLGPCSFLEVLLGLSRHLAFIAGGTAPRWAWQLLVNLRLARSWDHLSRSKTLAVQNTMDTVIKRTYNPNGDGGFFPLAWAERDQTEVELWYQLHAYVEELHPEY